jgi:hypothetical protein
VAEGDGGVNRHTGGSASRARAAWLGSVNLIGPKAGMRKIHIAPLAVSIALLVVDLSLLYLGLIDLGVLPLVFPRAPVVAA